LRKLDDANDYDAIILAFAGVHRLGWDKRISQHLEKDVMLHAVGQGALGLECREGDEKVIRLLNSLNHLHTATRCIAERSFMRTLEGGCSVPLGVYTVLSNNCLSLCGSVTSLDGSEELIHEEKFELDNNTDLWAKNAAQLGLRVAEVLLQQGAARILEEIREMKHSN
jgi:hydroxymethylbilane synthase